MKTADIEAGRDYLAWVGALAPVRILEAGIEYQYPTGGKTRGARVRALCDVPLLMDVQAAKQERRPVRRRRRQGDQFEVPAKDIECAAENATATQRSIVERGTGARLDA